MGKTRKRTRWSILFALSMASYCSLLFFEPESRLYAMWLMPSKALGFTLLLWSGKNKIMEDWDAFSAKRSKMREQRRAKIKD